MKSLLHGFPYNHGFEEKKMSSQKINVPPGPCHSLLTVAGLPAHPQSLCPGVGSDRGPGEFISSPVQPISLLLKAPLSQQAPNLLTLPSWTYHSLGIGSPSNPWGPHLVPPITCRLAQLRVAGQGWGLSFAFLISSQETLENHCLRVKTSAPNSASTQGKLGK